MIPKTRILSALIITVPLALLLLMGDQVVRTYPRDGSLLLANGQPLGGDYLAFYVGGRIFRTDRSRLYDLEHQRDVRALVLGAQADSVKGELPFVYPPLVGAALAPLSRLPFQRSFLIWVTFGLLVSLSSLVMLMNASGASNVVPIPLALLFLVGFVPLTANTLLGGQVGWFGIAILAFISAAILGGRDFLAGLATSLTYFKPPLFLFLLIALWTARGRRFGLGFCLGGGLLVGLTFLAVGMDGALSYLGTVSRYTYGQEVVAGTQLPPQQGMGLVGAAVVLFSSMTTTLMVLTPPFLFLIWVSRSWLRSEGEPERIFGLILSIMASLAFSLQLIRYDLALLLVPMVLGVAWYGTQRSRRGALVLLPFAGFYFEFVFREVTLGGKPLNASSFLFLTSLGLLVWWGWPWRRAAEDHGSARV